MNIALYIILIVLILVAIVLIYILINNKNTKIDTRAAKTVSQIKIEDLKFPKNIEKMDGVTLSQACRVIVESYRVLNYSQALPNVMDKIEWHSWQVSILLKAIKTNNTLSTFEPMKIFHPLIVELKAENRKYELGRILVKYNDRVNIEKDRDALSKDVIWSAREVAILLLEILKSK